MDRYLSSYISQESAECSTDSENETADKAYCGDLEATITILEALNAELKIHLSVLEIGHGQVAEVYVDWFEDAIENLKKKRKKNPFGKFDKRRGPRIDTTIAERDHLIVTLICLYEKKYDDLNMAYGKVNQLVQETNCWNLVSQDSDIAVKVFAKQDFIVQKEIIRDNLVKREMEQVLNIDRELEKALVRWQNFVKNMKKS
jgi:hypothetical protein